MRRTLPCILALLLIGCGEDSHTEAESSTGEQGFATVVFEVPDNGIPLLWQRSYPEEHAKLVADAEEQRRLPFSDPITVPDSQLTPGDFGIQGWDRAIVPRTFEQLGYPLQNGAKANYSAGSKTLTLTHTPAAVHAFEKRFPEFSEVDRKP